MELVVGLTPQEQHRKEEDPHLTLDGLYVNQPSRFLPLVQEAKKLAKKLKEKEEASQWSGIPIEKLLNDLFTEQLNYMDIDSFGEKTRSAESRKARKRQQNFKQ